MIQSHVNSDELDSHNPIIGDYVLLESANVDFIRDLAPGDTLKYTGSLFIPKTFISFAPDYFYVDAGFIYGDGSVSITTIYSMTDFSKLSNNFVQFVANITIPDNSVSMSLTYRFGINAGRQIGYVLGFQDSYLYLTGETLNRVVEQGKLDDIIGNDDSEESASGIKGVILWFKKLTSNISDKFNELFGSDESEDSASGIKGIILWIKNLPEKISLKIKEIFVPSEDSISSFKTNIQTLLSSRLGILWEIPDFIVTTFKSIINFIPSETHSIEFPAFNYNMSKSGEFTQGTKEDGFNFNFWSKQTITFSFLNDKPYSTLYSLYRVSVICMLLSALIALAVRKGNDILGGGS